MKKTNVKRLELFEFEDFSWLPNTIRAGVTRIIRVLHRLMGTSDTLENVILNTYEKTSFKQIVDLGSGAGGPMIDTVQKINRSNYLDHPLELLLSDKYPDHEIVQHINEAKISNIRYHKHPVDALAIGNAPVGLKTMIASFHHMSPTMAHQILQAAEHNREPLLIYELAENNVPFLVWLLLLPISWTILILMALFMTPFSRPLTLTQVVFTYIIPIIPIVYAWDGQASIMRTYTFEDIKTLIGTQTSEDYHWEVSEARKENGKKAGYYVLGYPRKD
ncbi:MAG: hypothetical protein AAF798_09745 [Bacteroidota bacterium]